MSNYRKSFNFRNGVQVDNDNFVVNPNGLVGIGTSVPTEFLDVRGTAKFVGLTTIKNAWIVENVYLAGVGTVKGNFQVGVASILSSGIITATSSSGIITYYGDGGKLRNLPTSQWIDVDPGFGYTSIYAAGYVGVATNLPYNALQVGGYSELGQDGVGINSTGDIKATGIITTRQLRFEGNAAGIVGVTSIIASTTDPLFRVIQLGTGNAILIEDDTPDSTPFAINASGRGFIGTTGDSSNVAGFTFYNSYARFISTITGNGASDGLLIGEGPSDAGYQQIHTYDRPLKIESEGSKNHLLMIPSADSNIGLGTTNPTSKVSVLGNVFVSGVTTVTELKASISTTGISTVTEYFHVGTGGTIFTVTNDVKLGIGTNDPTAEIQVRKPTNTLVDIVSDNGISRVSLGQSVGAGSSSGMLRFGSEPKAFEIINNDTGNVNFVVHGGPSGLNTGNFKWVYGQGNSEKMTLTYQGDLGLGAPTPSHKLHVVGASTVTGNAWFGSNVSIAGNLSASSFVFPSLIDNVNLNINSGISTFNQLRVESTLSVGSSVGLSTLTPIVDLDARGLNQLVGAIGINTDYEYLGTASGSLIVGGQVNCGGIGIGTTSIEYFTGTSGEILAIYGPAASIDSTFRVYNGFLVGDENSALGIGTHIPLCGVDFSKAGSGPSVANANFMRLPHATNAQRVGLLTQTGAVLFNTDVEEYQAYGGNKWFSLGNPTGIVTAENGFTSGTGGPVQISVVGSTLTFTVPGVGSTSLELF